MSEPLTPDDIATLRAWASEDHGETVVMTPTEMARILATLDAVRAHTLDLDSPETVERLVNAVHTARIGEPSHGHPNGLHVSCDDLVAAILAALREGGTA